VAGTPIIFDYRLGHRGLGNHSDECRPIVYLTYARKAKNQFRDTMNFSGYNKIGELLLEQPISREERAEKRSKLSS